jgi:hypothetical protein
MASRSNFVRNYIPANNNGPKQIHEISSNEEKDL